MRTRHDFSTARLVLSFDADFLSERVEPPQLTQADRDDSVMLDGRALIPYTHFSVNLRASRRLPRYVAWNRSIAPILTDPIVSPW